MMIFKIRKDGGPESRVTGYFLCEFKNLFTIALLRFDDGTRDAYHSHAFNAVSWVLKGILLEYVWDGQWMTYMRRFLPIYTPRDRMHKVISLGTTWVLTFRGPWHDQWQEYIPDEDRWVTLTHGRKEIA